MIFQCTRHSFQILLKIPTEIILGNELYLQINLGIINNFIISSLSIQSTVCQDLLCHLVDFIVFHIFYCLFLGILQLFVAVAFDLFSKSLVEVSSKTVWTWCLLKVDILRSFSKSSLVIGGLFRNSPFFLEYFWQFIFSNRVVFFQTLNLSEKVFSFFSHNFNNLLCIYNISLHLA